MCDPFTAMAIGGTVASAGGSLFSGFAGGDALNRQADFISSNAELMSGQARLLEESADLPLLKARVAQSRIRDAGNTVLARQSATVASNFMDPTYGSPLVIAARTVGQIESDMGIARATAQLERADTVTRSASLYQQVYGQRVQAAQTFAKAGAARAAGVFGAATALLGAGSKLSGLEFGSAKPFAGGWDQTNSFFAYQPMDI